MPRNNYEQPIVPPFRPVAPSMGLTVIQKLKLALELRRIIKNKTMFTSWKTTLAGLIGIALVTVPKLYPQFAGICHELTVYAISAGLIVARDGDKSSQQMGIRK